MPRWGQKDAGGQDNEHGRRETAPIQLDTEFGLRSGENSQGDEGEADALGDRGANTAVFWHQCQIEQDANQAARQPPHGRPIQLLCEQEAGVGQPQDAIKEDAAGDVRHVVGGGMKPFIGKPANDVAASGRHRQPDDRHHSHQARHEPSQSDSGPRPILFVFPRGLGPHTAMTAELTIMPTMATL